MSENKHLFKKRILWTCILSVWLLIIHIQSLLPAVASSAESGRVLEFLNSVISRLGLDFTLSSYLVRKSAHFSEFAILGILLCITLSKFESDKIRLRLFVPLLYSAVAVTDECLQLLSVGRACRVQDMILDICGATFGFLLYIVFNFVYLNKRKRNGF